MELTNRYDPITHYYSHVRVAERKSFRSLPEAEAALAVSRWEAGHPPAPQQGHKSKKLNNSKDVSLLSTSNGHVSDHVDDVQGLTYNGVTYLPSHTNGDHHRDQHRRQGYSYYGNDQQAGHTNPADTANRRQGPPSVRQSNHPRAPGYYTNAGGHTNANGHITGPGSVMGSQMTMSSYASFRTAISTEQQEGDEHHSHRGQPRARATANYDGADDDAGIRLRDQYLQQQYHLHRQRHRPT